jgi:hypothetical protein
MPSRRLSVAILTAVALLGSALTSDAASVSFVESQIGVNTGCPLQTGACAAPEFLFQPNLRFTTTSTALLSFNLTGGLAFSAQAQSAYGSLHSSASASFNLLAANSRFVLAGSTFGEYLTINSPGLDGQAGSLLMTFTVDGTIASSGSGTAFAFVGIQAGTDPGNADTYGENFVAFTSSYDGAVTLTIPIVYGREFFFKAALGAVAGTAQVCAACTYGVAIGTAIGPGTASAQFFNTLQLTGLTPMDGAGGFVGNSQFTSASGTPYGVNGVVPEPGSFVLLGTGLALGARLWRRRQSR